MRAEGEGTLGGGFEAGVGVGLGQAQDAEAGAVALLGMTSGVEDLGDECGGGGSDFLGPSRESFGRPLLGEPAVLLRHVLGHGGMSPAKMGVHMTGDALPAVEELDGVGGDLRFVVSPRLREEFENGRVYYEFDGEALANIPDRLADQPGRDYLEWHNTEVYLG